MLDDSIKTRSLRERAKLQEEYGTNVLPWQDLCYATFTLLNGSTIIADVISTDENEQIALLSYEENDQRRIWIAERDQNAKPGTWLWTEQQLEAAKRNPVRISDEENNFNFRGEKADEQRIKVAPIHKDRRIELLMLGLQLGISDAEVKEQLRKEGFDPTLPANYRSEQGELDLLKHWLPDARKPDK